MEHREIQTADADVVARKDEPPICVVPDRTRKRATEALERACAPAVVRVGNELLVGACTKPVPAAFERVAKLASIGQLGIPDRANMPGVTRPHTLHEAQQSPAALH